jgi:cysteinyl-tRNA synthetase
MAVAILGTDIDLHCGGVDNIFPHHENEIAQSECACGKTFARFWMHSEHLLVQNKKMAKSAGNFFTLRDLEGKGFSPREVRFMLMQGHYRTQLNFTMEGLEGARASLQRLDDFVYRLRHTTFDGGMHNEHIAVFDQAMKSFMQALADDLNVAEALSVVFTLIRQVNSLLDESKISQGDAEYLLDLLGKFDQVLALFQVEKEEISEEIEKLLALREKARKEKKWSESDAYRDQIEAKGFILEDSPQGPRLKRKKG